ncbi:hypothetical protein GG804_25185 [Sphingomonas histidinilytica]|uniref:hypothetical protein n=1 Tax=Rhizorhabdus histidinilytica TaxID=439228 RepID=UPI001ADA683D|nr:hypothetical protein [Rhizorhabdus histidinilytica]MBO9380067.1 hypothetical protein [Rhizorhabdus histidinilytica]
MALASIDHEATLAEVFQHVTLNDVGASLKSWVIMMMIYGLLAGCGLVLETVVGDSEAWSGYSFLVWVFLAWAGAHASFSERSFHKADLSYFFPRLRWWSSFVLAVVGVGLVFLSHLLIAGFGGIAWLLILAAIYPFLGLFNLMQLGHSRLMTARRSST